MLWTMLLQLSAKCSIQNLWPIESGQLKLITIVRWRRNCSHDEIYLGGHWEEEEGGKETKPTFTSRFIF